jgi:peptidoglycan/xylan/chitin deacetylase (PgdA/CDA1 family)
MKSSTGMRNPLPASVFAILLGLLLARCAGDRSPAGPSEIRTVPLQSDSAAVSVCRWPMDKAAAYTIGFDDVRASHIEVARPELNRAGLTGTFYVNTRSVNAWNSLRRMADEGHEIASHTWSHPRCGVIAEQDLRREIERAIEDIRNHLSGVRAVPSFSYPFGSLDETSRRIVSMYHLSARSGIPGIESGDADRTDFAALKAFGAYPPYDIDRLNASVREAVESRGWIIVYFHSISDRNRRGSTTIPLESFRRHLSFVCDLKPDLWIATQGQAASYILIRRTAVVSASVMSGDRIEVRVEGRTPEHGIPVPLCVSLIRPPEWTGRRIIAENPGTGRTIQFREPDSSRILLDMPVPSTCVVYAVQ